MELDETEKAIINAYRTGQGVLCNIDFGFMIEMTEQSNGRLRIECDEECFIGGKAQAEYVRDTIAAWSEALAEWDARNKSVIH